MSSEFTKRRMQGIVKDLSSNYFEEKKLKKLIKIEKANRRKEKRQKTKQQEITELVEQELDWDGEHDNDR